MSDELLPILPGVYDPETGYPLRAIGFRRDGRPVWPVMGAAPDEDPDPNDDPDDPDDPDPDDDPDDDKGDKGDEDGNWKPLSKAETTALQRRLRRASSEARRLKAEAKTRTKDAGGDKADVDKAVAEVEDKARVRIITAEAKGLLRTAGLRLPDDAEGQRRAVKRALRLLDMDDIDMDDIEDSVTEQIDELREDFPDLFVSKDDKGGKQRRRTGGDAGSGGDGGRGTAGSNEEKLKRAMLAATGR